MKKNFSEILRNTTAKSAKAAFVFCGVGYVGYQIAKFVVGKLNAQQATDFFLMLAIFAVIWLTVLMGEIRG